jgi:hypothetical protein
MYQAVDEKDKQTFRELIQDPFYTGGWLADLFQRAGYTDIDRMAVHHFRRKLRVGKATL